MKKIFSLVFFCIASCLRLHAQLSPDGLQFDGINDQVIMASPPAFDVYAGDFTIEAFIRDESNVTSGFSEEVILSNESTNPNSPGCRFSILWGSLTFMINGNGTGFQINGDLRDHQCHHVAVVRSNGTVTGYVDGEIATSYYIPDSLHSFFPLRLGAKGPISGPYSGFFNGMIKEVRLWNSARTWLEISNNRMTVLNVAQNPSLVGYWRCDEGSGTVINDYSGFNTGTFGDFMNPNSEPTWTTGCTNCIPQPAITAAGPLTFCSGGQVLLQTVPGAGYYSYQWKRNGINLPNWWSPDNAVTTSGIYTVEVYNSCGTSLSPPVQVTVHALPSATITASGSTAFCSGGNVTLNAVVLANRTYQWKKNGANIGGSVQPSYTTTSSGTYKVTVTNTNTGCSKTSGTGTVVTVYSNPTAVLTATGSTTFCAGDSVKLSTNYSANYTYIWKRNNVNISGALLNKYYPKTAGSYKVKATNANGCTTLSNAITVSVPCRSENVVDDNNQPFETNVYPNPSNGIINIENASADEKIISAQLSDVMGKILPIVIGMKIMEGASFQLNCTNCPNGIYMLSLYSNLGNVVNRKIVILK